MKGEIGPVKVDVTIDASEWSTSQVPSTEHDSYILPNKKLARTKKRLDLGGQMNVTVSRCSDMTDNHRRVTPERA